MLPTNFTIVDMTIDLHPFSVRGATFDLRPIDGSGGARRDINADLYDLSDPVFNKFVFSASCSDLRTPSFNDLKKGMTVTANLPNEWFYLIPNPEEDPVGLAASRPIVSGSLRDLDGYRYFRPKMIMMVMDFNQTYDEYAARYQWSLLLEEK